MDLGVSEAPIEAEEFFVAGGTLRANAGCYVSRVADRALIDALMHGEFCYVLNPRQIGKSSLMVQTTNRLREEQTDVAVLDLTSIGRNLNVEQWYFGLLNVLGGQLAARKELTDFWNKHPALGPLNRWFQAIDTVLLKDRTKPLVIFIDEIDYVRSLPFRTDEFFAAIRDCYNRRSLDTQFKKLTFCLLGVATPAELIADARMTPFNIGKRIELEDFTYEEAKPLATGLSGNGRDGSRLLKRVLHWTGGHPYLTQRLCHAVASDASIISPSGVDKTCEKLFLNEKARTADDNFAFVRHRLLNSAANAADLLDVYQRVLSGKAVRDEEVDLMVVSLKLSGVVSTSKGKLRVRNRIYWRVFDKKWVLQNLPDAERRRARRAFWKGLTVAGSVAALVTAGIGAIAIKALKYEHAAESRLSGVVKEAQRIAAEREDLRRQIYGAKMKFAGLEYGAGNIGAARSTLAGLVPTGAQQDYRGFEWHRLWKLTSDRSAQVLTAKGLRPKTVALTKNGEYVVAGGADSRLTVWKLPAGELTASIAINEPVTATAFNDDDSMLAVGTNSGLVKFFSMPGLKELGHISTGWQWISGLDFLSSSKIAVLNVDVVLSTWSIANHKLISSMKLAGPAYAMAVSPDKTKVAISGAALDYHVALFKLTADGVLRPINPRQGQGGGGIAFTPDGSKLVFGDSAGHVFIASPDNGQVLQKATIGRVGINSIAMGADNVAFLGTSAHEIQMLSLNTMSATGLAGHEERVNQLSSSVDHKVLASASSDGTVRIWNLPITPIEKPFEVTNARVRSLKFSPDATTILSGESDGAVILRQFPDGKRLWRTLVRGKGWEPTDIDPSQKYVAAATVDGRIEILDARTGTRLENIKDLGMAIVKVLFSPNGRYLLAVAANGTGEFYEVGSWKNALRTTITSRLAQVTDAAWSSDSRKIATATTDLGVFCFDLQTKTAQKLGTRANYSSVAFEPNADVIAGGRESGEISQWDLAIGRQTDFEGTAAGGILSMSYSPDGRTIAATGEGGTIYLWNVASQMQVGTIPADKVRSFALAFSPNGRYLISGGVDSVIRLWDANDETTIPKRLR